ncbi:PAS domain S-box protein [bacterium]|nr:PAS domain S-box protein [bacterium]
MKKKTNFSKLNELRELAEQSLGEQAEDAQETASEDIQHLIHELQVHQIELEMQNEELRSAQLELEESRNKYFGLFDLAPIGYFTIDKNGIIMDVNLTGANLLGVERKYLIQSLFPRYIAANYLDMFYSHQKRLFETETPQTCELKLMKRNGTQFYVQLESIVVQGAEGNSTQCRTAVLDITKRRRAEEAFQVSHRFLEIANRHTEMNRLLKEFVAEVKNFTGCAAVGIRILDEEDNIQYHAYEGFSQRFYELENPLSIKSDQCMCINVIRGDTDSQLPFYTAEGSFYVNSTTHFLSTVSEEYKGRTRNVCNQVGYESVILVPIRFGGRILGLIHVADPRENIVSLEIVEALESVAMQLGTTIQRVRTEEELKEYRDQLEKIVAERTTKLTKTNEQLRLEINERKQAEEMIRIYQEQLRSLVSKLSLAEERERRRIAEELHDSIVQDLSISNVLLGKLQESIYSTGLAPKVGEIRQNIKRAIQQTRSLTFQLSPPILDQMSFGAAVEWLLEQIQAQHGIQFHLEEDGQPTPMDEEVRIILFRTMRELLVNIIKHAKASNIKINICRDGDNIRINIEDDGVGFDTSKINYNLGKGGGFGLFNIREQLSYLGGQIDIQSEPDRGTQVTLVAPLSGKNEITKGE